MGCGSITEPQPHSRAPEKGSGDRPAETQRRAGEPSVRHDADPLFRVTLSGDFGGLRQGDSGRADASRLRARLGTPSSITRDPRYPLCRMHWRAHGVTAHFAVYGTETGDPCGVGIFRRARLTGRRWHTAAGVYPGVSEDVVKRAALRDCRRGYQCIIDKYTLSMHPSDCAAAEVPTVTAQVRHRRVASLTVASRTCE